MTDFLNKVTKDTHLKKSRPIQNFNLNICTLMQMIFFSKMFEYIFSPILARFGIPETERAYVMKFYLNGVFAIIMEWLNNNCSDDMEMIIKVIIDCVMGERNING